MQSEQKFRDIYKNAKEFLIQQIPAENAAEILAEYLNLPDKSKEPKSLSELYSSLLHSAQNANMKAGVIGGSMDKGVKSLQNVLCDFQPVKVLAKYQNAEDVLDAIVREVKPRGEIRREANSIWVRYSKTILSAAQFFNQFKDGEEFYQWANHFYDDKRAMAALPYLLSEEVYGIGYPLACDFLKGLGFINYGKPDVHIKDIFAGLKLCDENPSHATLQKIMIDMAAANGVSAFDVDKVFWLIGSGYFYLHENLGKKGKIGRQKSKFLQTFSLSD